MEIRGREIRFLRTVKATSDLARLCPDEDFERIGELFSGSIPKVVETGAKIIHYLNEGYEMNKHFDDPDYIPNIISVEEILYLDEETYTALMKSAFDSLNNGAETTIELAETKKNEKEKESS